MLTKEQVVNALPKGLKNSVSVALVDTINNVVTDPLIAEQVRNNFITYTSVLTEGKYRMEDYLNAIQYVTYKLMNYNNQDSYIRTFPQRYAALLAKGVSSKDLSSYVAAYNKTQLVNKILEQSIIPSWILNQNVYQDAINCQADLMRSAASEKVRCDAANSILTHLAKPKDSNFQINVDARQTTGMDELRDILKDLAQQQLSLIENGMSTKEVAGQVLIKKDNTNDSDDIN